MASSFEFILSGDHAAATSVVNEALVAEGYSFEPASPGWTKIVRGSAARTALLGGLAGKGFHMSFLLGFGVDPEGRLSVRLDRDIAMGALKGGAIGAAKTANGFTDTVNAIGAAATNAGVFVSSRELA